MSRTDTARNAAIESHSDRVDLAVQQVVTLEVSYLQIAMQGEDGWSGMIIRLLHLIGKKLEDWLPEGGIVFLNTQVWNEIYFNLSK